MARAEFRDRVRRLRKRCVVLIAVVVAVCSAPGIPASAGSADSAPPRATAKSTSDQNLTERKIKPQLAKQLEAKGEATFWVRFDATADLSSARQIEDWTERGQAVYDALTSTAEASQKQTLAVLKGEGARFETFWATNAIRVKAGSQELAERLAVDPAVAALYPTREYTLEKPTKGTDEHEVNAVEWGIANINADDVWDQYDVTGEGLVIANIDTGVQFDHPALANKYRGNNGDGTFDHNYNWLDASSSCEDAPCDRYGHGTHTMGTMVGDDGAGNQIGVAPGAKWIAANGCCPNDAALIASGEWMLAPTDLAGQNPRVALRPHIINNSWGTPPSNDPFMEDIQLAWAASGIFGMWANGNAGPSCQTSGSPGSRIINYSAGAYDIDNTIADFSSRGTGQDGEIKPNIAAPGVNVRSSLPGSSYGNYSGTSMASPHAAGTVALLWSAAPSLVGDIEATKALLDGSAVDVDATECGGDTEDNNVFGEGRLDALAAVAASPREPTGTLIGTVTDTTGEPMPGATVSLAGGPRPPSAVTDADGTYEIRHVIAGTHDVTASAFGYTSATQSAEIVVGQEATLDFTLDALATYPVTGTVTDGAGNPIPRATAVIEGTPLDPAVTDENGSYSFDAVPQGAYTVTVAAGGCFDRETADLAVDGPETLDAQLAERRDGFGHSCRLEAADYVEATEGLPINGDDVLKKIELPFAFPHYGATYRQAYVSSNGFVAFQQPSLSSYCPVNGCNMAIPTRSDPDAAIYAFWDDLMVDVESGGQVSTADLGDRFVIEWRNVSYFNNDTARVDVELVLYDDGQIVMQYRSLDTSWDRGATASVGIEDAYGTDAFQYSFDQAILTGDAIRFTRPTTGTVAGAITDPDGQPISGVSVTRTDARGAFQTATSGPDGTYDTALPVGTWTLRFAKRGFVTESHEVTVRSDGRGTLDAELRPLATAGPEAITATVVAGEQQTVPVQLTNNGTAPLDWEARERGGTGTDPATTQQPSQGTTDEPKILVYADRIYYPTPDAYVEQALDRLGLPYTAYTTYGDFDGFNAALAQGDWDLVIFAALALPASTTLDLLYDWVAGGGKLIIECQSMGYAHLQAHPLWAALGVEFVAEDWVPPRAPVHWWEPAHPLVTTPEAVPEQTEYTPTSGGVSPNGQYVRALPGATALAGYTEQPANIQAAMVIANDDRTLFRGFTDWSNVNDLDADGTYDMVELWTNSIPAIMDGFSQDVPWLEVSPVNGRIAPGQSQTVEVTVDTTGLALGTYTASVVVDGVAGPDGTRLTIPVRLVVGENAAPAGGADEYNTRVGEELVVEAPGVLANDTDTDGDTLTATGATQPANGEVELSADGSFTYSPDAGFSGTDTFTYKASDGTAESAPVTVTITVADDPDPVATKVSGVAKSFAYGERGKVAVSIKPTTATGKVEVRKGTKLLATGTLSAGKVTITLPARSLLPGQHQLALRYRGDPNHAASTATVKVTVRKAKPTLRYAVPKQVRLGQRATVNVAVLAPFGVPVSGVVRVSFAGKTVSGWLRADDRVVLRLPKATRAGWFKVRIAYLGSSVLEPASKLTYIRVRR